MKHGINIGGDICFLTQMVGKMRCSDSSDTSSKALHMSKNTGLACQGSAGSLKKLYHLLNPILLNAVTWKRRLSVMAHYHYWFFVSALTPLGMDRFFFIGSSAVHGSLLMRTKGFLSSFLTDLLIN